MEGNFSTSTYNRKSGIVVKKTSMMDFYWDRPVPIIDSIRKKPTSTYNRTSTCNRNLRVAATAKLLEPRSIKLFQLRQVLTDLRDQKGREDFLKLSLSLFNSWDNHWNFLTSKMFRPVQWSQTIFEVASRLQFKFPAKIDFDFLSNNNHYHMMI